MTTLAAKTPRQSSVSQEPPHRPLYFYFERKCKKRKNINIFLDMHALRHHKYNANMYGEFLLLKKVFNKLK